MRIDKKTLENQVMFYLLFSEYIKISKENNYGVWYFFQYENDNYLIQFIDSITNIKTLPLPKKYKILFIEKETFNVYTILDGFVKKDNSFKKIWRPKIRIDTELLNSLYMSLKVPEIGLQAISDRLRQFYLLQEFNPLQVQIMLLQGKVYLLYSESKIADKNNRYSINKTIIKKDFFTVHFVLEHKTKNINIFDKNNIIRTNVLREDIRIYNDLYYIEKNKYKKIKS